MTLVPSLQAGSQFGNFIFSHDSKYLFCCCGLVVKVFNTANGDCLHDLRAHTKQTTGVAVNPSNILQVISCGQDGLLIYWDYMDGVRLKQHQLHMPLYGIVSVNAEKKSIMMLAQTAELKTDFSLMLWKRKKTDVNEWAKPKMLIERCDGDQRLLSIGCRREFVGSGLKHKLSIYSMRKSSIRVVSDTEKFNRHKAITCVACHPTDYCIATGLQNGKIILWHNFFNEGAPATSSIHWHALPVLCIDFTPSGSNLLSGGHECVLVRWQTGNTSQRDFKPRMGSPITHVLCSPDGTFYATKHSDNAIQLLDINLKVLQVYRGLTKTMIGLKNQTNPIPTGLNFDPRSRTLVTNGLPGHLQFYSLSLGRQLFNLDIVGQNYVSAENFDQSKVVTQVTRVAINNDGSWLATFETWDDGVFSPERRLKIWSYSSEAQTYSLNTVVEHPHDSTVTSMLFRPQVQTNSCDTVPALVTVGEDACFKLWMLVDDTNIYRSNTRWSCDSVGFYRGMNAMCADFSTDASTLAVAFDHLLTIWDPDKNLVRTTLSNSLPHREIIKHVKFGSHECHQYLLVNTTDTLLSWNLLTLTVQWRMSVNISVLIRDPSSDLMACITTNRAVCMLRPCKSDLVYQQDTVSSSDIVDAVFVPDGRHEEIVDLGWPGRSQIYFYNMEQQLLALDLPEESITERSKVRVPEHLPQGALSAIMAEKLVRDIDGAEIKTTAGRKSDTDDSILPLILHSGEPVSLLCEQFLKSLLVKNKPVPEPHSQAVDEESSDSESDMETDVVAEQHETITKQDKTEKVINSNTTEEEEDMDKLLSKSLDWLHWWSSLHLKS